MNDLPQVHEPDGTTVGLVLAAGAGTRMGRPKALILGIGGRPWVETAVTVVLAGGCESAVVVLGAEAAAARALVPDVPGVHIVEADRWRDGLGASLKAGLAALQADATVDAALVTLVDLPTLPSAAVERILGARASRRGTLRQATFGARPGHPVLLGRDRWDDLRSHLHGDRGAGTWLRNQPDTEAVDCSDVWDGRDRDQSST